MKLRSHLFLVLLVLCLGGGGRLMAATTGLSGFDVRVFRPPADGSGLLNIHGADTLGQWQFSLEILADTSHGLLKAVNPSGNQVEIVSDLLTQNTLFAVGLFNFLSVGINLPITFFEQGENFFTLENFDTSSFGDIAFDVKLRLLKSRKFLPGLALISETTVPSGNTEKFTGFSNVTEEVRLAIDKTIGPVYLVANGAYRMVPKTQVVGLNIDDMLVFGGGFGWVLPMGHGNLELLGEVDGSVVMSDPTQKTSPVEWSAGLRQKISDLISAEFGGGGRITDSYGGDWRLLGTVHFKSSPLNELPPPPPPEKGQTEEQSAAKKSPKRKKNP
jgi:OmpA-OmpF porin, OOP family